MEKKERKFWLLIVILGILSLFTFQMSLAPIWAQTQSDQGDVNQEGPSFSNPAQAAHAANLAAAVAPNDPAVQAAFDALKTAEQNLQNALALNDPAAISAAQAAYDAAKANAEAALAAATGVAISEIAAMRSAGLGWGEIAHSLGVHPGVLGLGHTKGVTATERDVQTGLAKGHGVSSGSSSGGKGLGGSSSHSHGGGHSVGHGGGQGGGHGGGQGGGHGGGHGSGK